MGQRAIQQCRLCYSAAITGTRLCARHKDADSISEKQRRDAQPRPLNPNSKGWRQASSRCVFRYGGQCAQLNIHGVRCMALAREAHHKVRWPEWSAQGGGYTDQCNLIPLCKSCHQKQTVAERTGIPVPGSFAEPSEPEFSPV